MSDQIYLELRERIVQYLTGFDATESQSGFLFSILPLMQYPDL